MEKPLTRPVTVLRARSGRLRYAGPPSFVWRQTETTIHAPLVASYGSGVPPTPPSCPQPSSRCAPARCLARGPSGRRAIQDYEGCSFRLRGRQAVSASESARPCTFWPSMVDRASLSMGSSSWRTRRVVFRSRLSDTDRLQSIVEPGTLDGPFSVLYVHTMEAVSEIRNATVHGFLVWALEPTPDGYQLFWAIHVLPVGVWTKPYLALIDPFRRWLVYPALLRRIHESWTREFKSAA